VTHEALPAEWRLNELESLGEKRIDPAAWAYIQGGAGEELALGANRDAFHRRTLVPRYLVDVSTLDLRTTLLGRHVEAPIFVAPMAYQGRLHPDGERATARAAARAGLVAIFSTLSTASLEEIAEAAPEGNRWFQLYLQPDLEASLALVARAERAGYSAIVLTVDMPVFSVRDRQARAGFAELDQPHGNGPKTVPPIRLRVQAGGTYSLRAEAGTTWSILETLHGATTLPIVVKGLLSAEDARRAVKGGARGIVVSNHGGRQLDSAPSALDVLPGIVEAVRGQVEVYYDGGVRRGMDVLIALAMGAHAVGLGRPVLWALAAGGEPALGRLFELFETELASAMALTGRPRIPTIDRGLLGPLRW
jgi:4-hydroxymandelate oxidase